MKTTKRILIGAAAIIAVMGSCVFLMTGYGSTASAPVATKPPLPVSVIELVKSHPSNLRTMSGSVNSWKTEEIAFEVGGRILQVLEPSADIEGRILDQTGDEVLSEGTVLARLDDQRYRIAVESAEAAIEVARRRMEVIDVDIRQSIPARLAVAETELDLAEAEFNRARMLESRNAISQSEFDQARTTYETAESTVETRSAERAAKQAELRSVQAQIEQAQLELAKAERDQRDATLYSSFRGQVAQVHVIPGSYVAAGQPVLTIQMMDPIKVELELSATMSRRFRYGDRVRLYGANADGQPIPLTGFVYMTDPVADAGTRTFTVTLLVRNQKIDPLAAGPEASDQPMARTADIWPLDVESIVGGGVAMMVEAKAIQHDSQGAFVWKVTNRYAGETPAHPTRVLDVTKVRVTQGDLTVPFLGNWSFVPIVPTVEGTLDPQRDLVTGAITVDGNAADAWNGDRVLLDRSDWLLRPGDVVRIDLPNGEHESGCYVPVRAIQHNSGQDSVLVVDQSPSGASFVRKVDVTSVGDTCSNTRGEVLRRIVPTTDGDLPSESRLIVEGVQYLVDGDAVSIVDRTEDAR